MLIGDDTKCECGHRFAAHDSLKKNCTLMVCDCREFTRPVEHERTAAGRLRRPGGAED